MSRRYTRAWRIRVSRGVRRYVNDVRAIAKDQRLTYHESQEVYHRIIDTGVGRHDISRDILLEFADFLIKAPKEPPPIIPPEKPTEPPPSETNYRDIGDLLIMAARKAWVTRIDTDYFQFGPAVIADDGEAQDIYRAMGVAGDEFFARMIGPIPKEESGSEVSRYWRVAPIVPPSGETIPDTTLLVTPPPPILLIAWHAQGS